MNVVCYRKCYALNGDVIIVKARHYAKRVKINDLKEQTAGCLSLRNVINRKAWRSGSEQGEII